MSFADFAVPPLTLPTKPPALALSMYVSLPRLDKKSLGFFSSDENASVGMQFFMGWWSCRDSNGEVLKD